MDGKSDGDATMTAGVWGGKGRDIKSQTRESRNSAEPDNPDNAPYRAN